MKIGVQLCLLISLTGTVLGALGCASMESEQDILTAHFRDIVKSIEFYKEEYNEIPEFENIEELFEKLDGDNPDGITFYTVKNLEDKRDVFKSYVIDAKVIVGLEENVFFFISSGPDNEWGTEDDFVFVRELSK